MDIQYEDLNTTMLYARVRDATVEADYRQFTNKIEKQRVPLFNLPIPADNWLTRIVKAQIAS